MSQALAEHVHSITKILGVRRSSEGRLDLAFPTRCKMTVVEARPDGHWSVPLQQFREFDNSNFVYIENSYGFASRLQHRRMIYVPMWEQGSTPEELQWVGDGDLVVSVTHCTSQFLTERHQRPSRYLPWPVEVPKESRIVSSVKTILHNAGSLGGNLRKGTPQAIEIFQRSGVAKKGVRLVIHSWMEPPEDIAKLIAKEPHGIWWTNRFLPRFEDIYNGVDLLLMPSKIEGHALVVLEAMARGIPALVTDSAPINEYPHTFTLPVERYETSPLAAPYAIVDVQEGAALLRGLCSADLTETSRESRSFVEREMSWTALGKQWEELCQ